MIQGFKYTRKKRLHSILPETASHRYLSFKCLFVYVVYVVENSVTWPPGVGLRKIVHAPFEHHFLAPTLNAWAEFEILTLNAWLEIKK